MINTTIHHKIALISNMAMKIYKDFVDDAVRYIGELFSWNDFSRLNIKSSPRDPLRAKP